MKPSLQSSDALLKKLPQFQVSAELDAKVRNHLETKKRAKSKKLRHG